MNRRGFLRTSPPLAVPEPPPAASGDLTLVRVSRRAMATTFEIALPVGTPFAVEAAEDALDLIDRLEQQLTVYHHDSEVARLNAAAAARSVVVEERLFDLLSFAAAVTNDTRGAFDAAAGALVKVWGFYKREGSIPPPAALKGAREASGTRHVVLDPAARSVKFRRAGLEINLGGIGKGYALDRAAQLLRTKWGVTSALLHGGGSSVLTVGRPPGQFRGWAVALRHPTDDARTLGTVYLADQGLGTSAATFQFFVYNKKKYGHLLDPRTGWPAEGTASASVVAPTAAEADALSTALFVLGAGAAANHCESRPWLAAVVLPDGEEQPAVAGLPENRYDPPGVRDVADDWTLNDW